MGRIDRDRIKNESLSLQSSEMDTSNLKVIVSDGTAVNKEWEAGEQLKHGYKETFRITNLLSSSESASIKTLSSTTRWIYFRSQTFCWRNKATTLKVPGPETVKYERSLIVSSLWLFLVISLYNGQKNDLRAKFLYS